MSMEFDLRSCLIVQITRIIMDPYNSLSFKKTSLDFKDTIVTLLIDNWDQ